MFIHIYIYIYPPALACQGPPGWEANGLQDSTFSFFQYSISNSTYLQFDVLQVSNLVFDGLQVSNLVLLLVYCTPRINNLPPNIRLPSAWGGSGETLKFIKISSNLQYPKNHQIGLPRPPKVSKMRSKQAPKIIKFIKKSKT